MSRSLPSATAVVLGGGVVGLTTALQLATAGYRVTLLERGELARQSSWAGGGLLSPLYPWRVHEQVWALAAASLAVYPALCALLAAETGIDPEYTGGGLTVLDAEAVEPGLHWAAQQGLAATEVLASEGLASPQRALHFPWVAQLRNPRLCRALIALLRARGVGLLEHAGDVRLSLQGARARAETATGRWDADVLVVCAGAWTGELLQGFGAAPAIHPVKGQMLLLRGAPGAVPGLLLQGGRYLIPRRDGAVLVGSTLEHTGFDARTTEAAAAELRAFADALVPACRVMALQAHWAGLRPGSADGVPTIGRSTAADNLFINAGHHRYGLTMAPASAVALLKAIEVG